MEIRSTARRSVLPGWARKLVVAILAVGGFLLDLLLPEDTSVVSAITVGLLVGIIAAIFETQLTITDSGERSQALLVSNQESIQREVGAVSRLNRLRIDIRKNYDDVFMVDDILTYEWTKFERRLEALSGGRLESRGFETLIVRAARNPDCHEILGVTTLPAASNSAENWWHSKAGVEYRQENYRVVQRMRNDEKRFPVQRIWVYENDEDLMEPQNARLLKEQITHGVLVRTYKWRDDALVPNFTIWNRGAAWEATLNWSSQMIGGTFYADKETVGRLMESWDRLERDATELGLADTIWDGQTRVILVRGWEGCDVKQMESQESFIVNLTNMPLEGEWLRPLQVDPDLLEAERLGSDKSKCVVCIDLGPDPGGSIWSQGPDEVPGALIVRRHVKESTPWTAGQQVEVYPVWAAEVHPDTTNSSDGDNGSHSLSLRLRAKPNLYAHLT